MLLRPPHFAAFDWQPSNNFFRNNWRELYEGVRNANSLLDNIDNVTSIPSDKIAPLKGEAQFLRAFNYSVLQDLFGGVPLITSANELNLEPTRSSNEETIAFIESELNAATNNLPIDAELSGKATKGSAQALLGRVMLNAKQWQKAADAFGQVINSEKIPTLYPRGRTLQYQ